MAYVVFKLSCDGTEAASAPLNEFLRTHRVLHVSRQWVEAGAESFWTFCVEYRDGEPTSTGARVGGKVDYREILPPKQFELFARLRTVRKALAERDAVSLFAVFTNEQLADMVRCDCQTLEQLRSVEGVGEARVEKYGPALLAEIQKGQGSRETAPAK